MLREGSIMSITISFSMRPRKNWISGQGWNTEKLQEFAVELAGEMGYHCDAVGEYAIYQFCPEGFLWMGFKAGRILGECQTNIAGPGFHAAVIHFLELFAARAELGLYVEDATGYYEERDFLKMRRNYFYQWFTDLMATVLEKKDEAGDQLVCWPTDYYLPEEHKDMITTHIRRFAISEIAGMMRSGMSMAFARDFFIWNEEEKDAYYYRNSALVMLNQECYFMPSVRSREDQDINHKILALLERALAMKPDIPFPKKEYLELCTLAEHEPVDVSGVTEYAKEIEIGCRKGLLFRTIGCMRFAVPGNYLYDSNSRGNSERYYDGKNKDGHEFYICALNTRGEASFQEAPFQKDTVQEVQEFQSGGTKGKIAVYRPMEKDGKTVHSVAAQMIYKNQMTIVSINYENPEDRAWAFDLIRRVQAVEQPEPEAAQEAPVSGKRMES